MRDSKLRGRLRALVCGGLILGLAPWCARAAEDGTDPGTPPAKAAKTSSRSRQQLRTVLPPGLMGANAAGQFGGGQFGGGRGGFGGGFGGGNGGFGNGGFGGGNGGFGNGGGFGGNGGLGGNRGFGGNNGGNFGGGGFGGNGGRSTTKVLPAPIGLFQVSRLVMQTTGRPAGINGGSWDTSSLNGGFGGAGLGNGGIGGAGLGGGRR